MDGVIHVILGAFDIPFVPALAPRAVLMPRKNWILRCLCLRSGAERLDGAFSSPNVQGSGSG